MSTSKYTILAPVKVSGKAFKPGDVVALDEALGRRLSASGFTVAADSSATITGAAEQEPKAAPADDAPNKDGASPSDTDSTADKDAPVADAASTKAAKSTKASS